LKRIKGNQVIPICIHHISLDPAIEPCRTNTEIFVSVGGSKCLGTDSFHVGGHWWNCETWCRGLTVAIVDVCVYTFMHTMKADGWVGRGDRRFSSPRSARLLHSGHPHMLPTTPSSSSGTCFPDRLSKSRLQRTIVSKACIW
jgi:hypothetical protein